MGGIKWCTNGMSKTSDFGEGGRGCKEVYINHDVLDIPRLKAGHHWLPHAGNQQQGRAWGLPGGTLMALWWKPDAGFDGLSQETIIWWSYVLYDHVAWCKYQNVALDMILKPKVTSYPGVLGVFGFVFKENWWKILFCCHPLASGIAKYLGSKKIL